MEKRVRGVLLISLVSISVFSLFVCSRAGPDTIDIPAGTPIPIIHSTSTNPSSITSQNSKPTEIATNNPPDLVIAPSPTETTTPTKTPIPTVRPTMTPFPEFTKVIKQEIIAWLVKTRREDGDSDEVRKQLLEDGWIREDDDLQSDPLASPTERSFLNVDLNGDGQDEWIMTILTNGATCWVTTQDGYDFKVGGELWIINKKGLAYELLSTNEEYFWGAPIVVLLADMTGDGLPDMVTKSVGCGAHTKVAMYHVISAQNGKIENIVEPYNKVNAATEFLRTYNPITNDGWKTFGISFPTPDEETLSDNNGDGLADLVLNGGTFGSSGAGFVRYRTEIWSWDGSDITLMDVLPESTNERSHILYDANYSFDLGNYQKAVLQYEQVVFDQDLTNYSNTYFFESEYNPAQVFASFRLELLSLIEKDVDSAEKWRDWLSKNYPGTPITVAGAILLDAWQKTNSLQKSCKAVTDYLVPAENMSSDRFYSYVTGTLSDAGYSIKGLWAVNVCPLK
jgi:hypothetical protein